MSHPATKDDSPEDRTLVHLTIVTGYVTSVSIGMGIASLFVSSLSLVTHGRLTVSAAIVALAWFGFSIALTLAEWRRHFDK